MSNLKFLVMWLSSRRLNLLVCTLLVYLVFFNLLRALFFFGFSGFENTQGASLNEIISIFYIGFKFDLRLAILLILPMLILVYFPKFNLISIKCLQRVSQGYLLLMSFALMTFYVFDFGHYSYLGFRINADVMRFANDRESTTMVWQSYPVIWITLGVLATVVCLTKINFILHRYFLEKPAVAINIPSRICGGIIVFIVGLLCGFGRFDNLNIHNPVPLRWNEVYFTDNKPLAETGLNPLLFFIRTFEFSNKSYDLEKVKKAYPLVVDYLSLDNTDEQSLSLDRSVSGTSRLKSTQKTPNVVFIMLESLGASRVSAYGLPYESTPVLDEIARDSLFFENFYVPVSGTAKTVWASITGIPDVSTKETATRNPHISEQRVIHNAFTEHEKLYFIGGNASWANMSSMIEQSIDGVTLYQEDYWQSPATDVWGISDLDLFNEVDQMLAARESDEPFMAYIQTAGNHRPFSIPENRGDFETVSVDAEQLSDWGFRSNKQLNAVRFLDYCVGDFFARAKTSGYFDNTIFVLYGDHNNRITSTPHMAPFYEALDLDGLHVPHMIYAPELLEPQVVKDAVSLVDVVPTVAGLLGLDYQNTALGRDVFTSLEAQTGKERFVFTSTSDQKNPTIGLVSNRHMLRLKMRNGEAALHDLTSSDPAKDIRQDNPELYSTLRPLTEGVYELSLYHMYNNRQSQNTAQVD